MAGLLTDDSNLQLSTWDLIVQYCPKNEVDEVKNLLGSSLVEQVEDLHGEVKALLEIWRQIREDTDDIISSGKTPLHSFLPEPPHVRERLVQEIKFFVSFLKKEGSNSLSHFVETDQSHLIEYVTSGGGGGVGRSRPQSAVDVSEAPLKSTNLSTASSLLEEIDQITTTNIEGIIKNLRKMLEEESEHCHSDIQFLRDCLEDEEHFFRSLQVEQSKPIPTLKELREFGSQLEKEYLSDPKHSFSPDQPMISTQLTPMPPAEPKPLHEMTVNRASRVRHSPLASGRI